MTATERCDDLRIEKATDVLTDLLGRSVRHDHSDGGIKFFVYGMTGPRCLLCGTTLPSSVPSSVPSLVPSYTIYEVGRDGVPWRLFACAGPRCVRLLEPLARCAVASGPFRLAAARLRFRLEERITRG